MEDSPIPSKRENSPVRIERRSAADALIGALPDLVVLVGRDGVVLAQGGGCGLTGLRPMSEPVGSPLGALWPAPIAALLQQLVRKSIAQRAPAEGRFADRGRDHAVRVEARGPDRAICIIRAVEADALENTSDTAARPRPHLDRRGFLRRFKETLSWAALRETPVALAVIQIDGITDIAQVLAAQISEQVMSAAILRLPTQSEGDGPAWYIGQLSESLLALVIESADRDAIDACVAQVCWSLREPILVGDAEFQLTPHAGAAILGQDASSPKALLDHARGAAAEARRSGSAAVHFFTDTVRLRALSRLDLARELREAIDHRDIRLRYVGRHDLRSGRLLACVGYLEWRHPLRGEIRPAEFLRLAAATGLSAALSRAVLACLREDYRTLAAHCDPDVRISFGALRHHVLHEDFVRDVADLLTEGAIPADRLELRIAEKVFITREPAHFSRLDRLGVQLVIDEVGRGMGSLDSLARAPIWGLQLDRAWVAALRSDPVARKVCGAGIGMAASLGLVPIATGVDDAGIREALLALGCRSGSGDLYHGESLDITRSRRSEAAAPPAAAR
ncbi:MAG: EAL domain-containing protein [Steroidobacteraceae bacterium]